MELYHFRTEWKIPAGIEPLWAEIIDAPSWPAWTPSFRQVRIIGGEPLLILGSRGECEVKGALPFRLRFSFRVTEYVPERSLSIVAWGDVQGTGRWVLEPEDVWTSVTYFWDVGLSRPFLDRLGHASVTKALLSWNHDRVMAQAGRGLAARVGRRVGRAEPSEPTGA